MSGGTFEYKQYHITDIADKIERAIEMNGKEKTKEELKNEFWNSPDWYEKYPEEKYHYEYPPEVIAKFKEAVYILRVAHIYAHRIDYLMASDDGEESFLRRLQEDLKKLNKEQDERYI